MTVHVSSRGPSCDFSYSLRLDWNDSVLLAPTELLHAGTLTSPALQSGFIRVEESEVTARSASCFSAALAPFRQKVLAGQFQKKV